MPVKTITITEEAYRKLARIKRPEESFTDVVNRILGWPSVLDLAGILEPEAGGKLEEEAKRIRGDLDERV